jgi:hypothetical protein
MDEFLESMQQELDGRDANSEHAFAARALFTFLQLCGYEVHPAQKKDPEFGFAWFHSTYPNYPVYLEARRTVVNLTEVVRNLPKIPQFDELMALMEESGREHCGIIVRATMFRTLAPLWIIHSAWNLDHPPGKIRLAFRAKSKDRGVTVERLDSFVESVKLSGWTF